MNLAQPVLEALQSLTSNKLRSALTILGIVIGVAAVIAMLAVGEGAQASILGEINGIGSNLLFVNSGSTNDDVRNIKPLTVQDAGALADPILAPAVELVAPVVSGQAEVVFAGEQTRTSIMGVTPEYAPVRNYTVGEGEFITQEQELGRASVAVIGVDVADKLFGRREALTGETIRIDGQPFRVIGVLTSKGGSSFGSQDNVVIVPLSSARTRILRYPGSEVGSIMVKAADGVPISEATEQISEILRSRHRTAYGEEDFTVISQQDVAAMASSITSVLTIFLGGIAGISMLVGGIGIMNIMLVSVTERTREIGLRKALGARRRDILAQFLTESALLSLLGGLIGILLGWAIAAIVARIAAASGTPLPAAVTPSAVLLAVAFSTAIGLFFGIYPASRAARLVPVEALRYE